MLPLLKALICYRPRYHDQIACTKRQRLKVFVLPVEGSKLNEILRGGLLSQIQFLRNEANKVEGLAYAGFETFRGSPYTSCARETGQNSRDAALGTVPVQVAFNLREIPRSEIPFADHLQRSIECCLESPRDQKTRDHLERALIQISAPSVKILEIADLNTTGLTGPVDDESSVFAALVKGDGVTNKSDPTSAGSYGIGKNAAYAVSDLQTVIYSTCFHDPRTGEKVFAAQGRLRLISHMDDGEKLSAEGYWGNPNFTPITSLSEVPGWIAREAIGTSIFSVGFREQDHWADRMRLSLATNFFLAVMRNEIEFSVDGVKLNQHSIESILDSPSLTAIAAASDETAGLERAKRLMLCVSSEAASRHKITVKGLGDFDLHLLIAENMPREIHILRNGIYICDNFGKFGLPMRAYRGTKEYIAVLEPGRSEAGKKPSQLLKQLENPAHDAFEPERIVDAAAQKAARQQIKDLISQVRAIIKSAALMDEIDHSHLDELSHLFASGGASSNASGTEGETDPEHFRYGEARRSSRNYTPTGGGKTKAKARRGKDTGLNDKKKAERTTQSKAGPSGVRDVTLGQVRSVVPLGADQLRRTIFFTPEAGGNIEISVSAAGLSSDVELTLAGVSEGVVNNGRLRAVLVKGRRTAVDVIFSEPFSGPIELAAISLPTVAHEV